MSMQQTNTGAGTTPAAGTESNSLPNLNDLKGQASQAADEARNTLKGFTSEARNKLNEIVDHQKSVGADHLSGLAQAANAAAGELNERNPQVARLITDAASSVDRFAGDLRDRDVRDVLASVSSFARQQPVAFFAGSILAGFALARFLKSDAPAGTASRDMSVGGGYRHWSATHQDGEL